MIHISGRHFLIALSTHLAATGNVRADQGEPVRLVLGKQGGAFINSRLIYIREDHMRTRRVISGLAIAGACAVLLAGCGSGLTAKSSCSDFNNASSQDQDAAVSKIAGQLHAGNAVTPLGRPNVSYICANSPTTTLGDAIRHTG